MINRDNYEIWFIDYLDGNLDDRKTRNLQQFLENNPDLQEELKDMESMHLEPESITYAAKDALKKTHFPTQESFDTACVDLIEGNATITQKAELMAYTQSRPEKARELRIFKATVLPKENIPYPFKEKLYKKALLTSINRWVGAAAAIFIGLLVASIVWLQDAPNQKNTQLAQAELVSQPSTQEETTPKIAPQKPKVESAPVYASQETMVYKPQETKAETAVKQESREPQRATLEPLPQLDAKSSETNLRPTRLKFAPAPLQPVPPAQQLAEPDQRLLAGLFNKNTSKIQDIRVAPSVLNFLEEVSSNKISYEEENGAIAQISYESRLLSFSVPVNSRKN